ncbi:DUF4837 family protein [Dokdonia sp. Hel_I_53]|uniref:DUF4837 family protein n=1 Tax=Dokdonia sp. Hel_I_53 TaxID=1566287 RepID=UPI001199EABA|nr:DUF4837 family protein [Dokdonia sp. Hel_I_53]TVZ52655.1 uncharacterized protein DUF4837 [Dokdonia sp. Hel_I_53]
MIKNIFFVVLTAFIICSCSDTKGKRILGESVGNINNVKVVLDKDQWEGTVGDALRDILADPVYGLPREEPKFSIDQIPTASFKDFLRKNRIYIQIVKADSATVTVVKDKYAQPQTGIIVSGSNQEEIANLIIDNEEMIVNTLKDQELVANQRRIKKALKNTDSLVKSFGARIRFPNAYRYAFQEGDFFWIRKDLKRNGNMNIIVYEIPLEVIDKDTLTIKNIIRMRDSIGGSMIPVDDGRFITERAFSPYLQETQIDGKFAYETKGTWEVDGRYMAGPFVNYAIRDEENNRYLILEGFIFSPSQDQRDNMFELESILRSAKLR